MFSTKHGFYDGDSWEALMQICLRIKYELEHYQQLPASPGDYGIEGFTQTGKVFQCYCPDSDYTSEELYEKQRDKVTKDLNKLRTYEMQLQGYLKETKIKQWIFLIPSYKKKEIVRHCLDKAEEIRSWGLSIVDPSFQVLIHDMDNFTTEIGIALQSEGKVILQAEKDEVNPAKVIQWKEQSIDYVDNALRKHLKRFPQETNKTEMKVNELTDISITDFLNGESILTTWKQIYPDSYEKFLLLSSQLENEIRELCMFPSNDNNELYLEIKIKTFERIKSGFSFLDDVTITDLTNRMVAYWIIRCPLDFE